MEQVISSGFASGFWGKAEVFSVVGVVDFEQDFQDFLEKQDC